MDPAMTWIPVTEVRKVKYSKTNITEFQSLTNWTAYKSATNGEVMFAVLYADDTTTVFTDETVEKLVELLTIREENFTMDLVCEMGNRRDEARITPFLPDKYVFLWAEKHSKPIRGEMPKTFEEYLFIVTRVDKPSVAQSVYSPGTNQQFTSAAAIMANPTPLPAPETAPSPPKPASRKRAPKKKEVTEEAKPVKKRKQPVVEEPETPPKPAKAKSAPKRQKVVKDKSVAEQVVAMIGEKIAGKLQELGEAKIANLRSKFSHVAITAAERTPQTELNKVEVMFALAYLAHLINTGYSIDIHRKLGHVNLMDDLDFKVVTRFKEKRAEKFIVFGQFVIKGLCYTNSGSAKALLVYHSSVVEAIQKLVDCAEPERDALITEMIRNIREDGNATKLTLFYDSLIGPVAEPEPDLDGVEY
jgi:hypothetical protein